jgi:hypothetical protein
MQDRFKFRAWEQERKIMHGNESKRLYMSSLGVISGFRLLKNVADDLIVMQCTGIKDKNGQLIYEGDVIRHDAMNDDGIRSLKEIRWDNFWCKYLVGPTYLDLGILSPTQWEIVGNIYENTELLK